MCNISRCFLSGIGTALTISTMFHGEYGIRDVCLSTLSVVDGKGVSFRVPNQLTEEELGKLRGSAERLQEVIGQVGF